MFVFVGVYSISGLWRVENVLKMRGFRLVWQRLHSQNNCHPKKGRLDLFFGTIHFLGAKNVGFREGNEDRLYDIMSYDHPMVRWSCFDLQPNPDDGRFACRAFCQERQVNVLGPKSPPGDEDFRAEWYHPNQQKTGPSFNASHLLWGIKLANVFKHVWCS